MNCCADCVHCVARGSWEADCALHGRWIPDARIWNCSSYKEREMVTLEEIENLRTGDVAISARCMYTVVDTAVGLRLVRLTDMPINSMGWDRIIKANPAPEPIPMGNVVEFKTFGPVTLCYIDDESHHLTFVGLAICSPEDTYDYRRGCLIAEGRARLMQREFANDVDSSWTRRTIKRVEALQRVVDAGCELLPYCAKAFVVKFGWRYNINY